MHVYSNAWFLEFLTPDVLVGCYVADQRQIRCTICASCVCKSGPMVFIAKLLYLLAVTMSEGWWFVVCGLICLKNPGHCCLWFGGLLFVG